MESHSPDCLFWKFEPCDMACLDKDTDPMLFISYPGSHDTDKFSTKDYLSGRETGWSEGSSDTLTALRMVLDRLFMEPNARDALIRKVLAQTQALG